jgi:hypothetical protein
VGRGVSWHVNTPALLSQNTVPTGYVAYSAHCPLSLSFSLSLSLSRALTQTRMNTKFSLRIEMPPEGAIGALGAGPAPPASAQKTAPVGNALFLCASVPLCLAR